MLIKAVVTLPYWTNIPADVSTNGFWLFKTGEIPPTEGENAAILAAFQSFYNTAFSGGMLSPVVNVNGFRLRTYNWSDPPPRAPMHDVGMSINSTIDGAQGMPEEVACVLSFQGVRESGDVQARRRGRIYLGPLGTSAIDFSTSASYSLIDATFRTQMISAAQGLYSALSTNQTPWVVHSTSTGAIVDIDNGWIDVNPDTQRRRGGRLVTRNVFSV